MADAYIQVAPDSTGKKMQTVENTVSGQDVHAEVVVLANSSGAPISTLPVSAASLPLPSTAATSTKQSDGSQKSQVVGGSGNVALVTSSGSLCIAIAESLVQADVTISADSVGLSTLAAQVDGSQITQITDSIGTIVSTTGTALDVNIKTPATLPVSVASVPTHAVTQSGTWTVQPGNTANTTAWKVDGSAVTQPISAVSLPLPSTAATSTKQSDGSQKSQVVDGSGNVIGATGNALDVNIKTPATLPVSVAATIITKGTLSSTATTSQVADTASSTTLLSLNANRLGATITNDSTANLYVKLGTTASLTDYTVRIIQYGYYEVPYNYTGRIDGIWATNPSSGSARITELT